MIYLKISTKVILVQLIPLCNIMLFINISLKCRAFSDAQCP